MSLLLAKEVQMKVFFYEPQISGALCSYFRSLSGLSRLSGFLDYELMLMNELRGVSMKQFS